MFVVLCHSCQTNVECFIETTQLPSLLWLVLAHFNQKFFWVCVCFSTTQLSNTTHHCLISYFNFSFICFDTLIFHVSDIGCFVNAPQVLLLYCVLCLILFCAAHFLFYFYFSKIKKKLKVKRRF